MGVPDDYAGKRVRCPQCGRTVTVPGAKTSLSTRSAPAPVKSDNANPVPLDSLAALSPQDDEENRLIWTDDLLKPMSPPPLPLQTSPDSVPPPIPSVRKCPKCGSEVAGTVRICSICGCFVGGVSYGTNESDQKPKRSFWQDLLYLLSPVHSVGDGIKLFFLIIISIIMNLTIYFASYILLSGIIVICGYWCAYMFSVVVETAGGDDELPEFPGVMSYWEDLLHPFLLWIASFLYAFLPTIILVVYYEVTGLDRGGESFGPHEKTIVFSLGAIGLFFWPMILLGLSLGESLGAVRPDLVLRSIGKTILPYVVCCLCLYGCVFLWFASYVNMVKDYSGSTGGLVFLWVADKVGGVCLWLYAMRTMGLLYRHYHRKLVW